ncbi:MAG: hypothetical protein ACRDLT_13420 [Solirubrobacteraceae bacterium]
MLIAGPNADLVAVGVDTYGWHCRGREHHHSGGFIALVPDVVATSGSGREADQITGAGRRDACGSAHLHLAGHHEQPLLDVFGAIRAERLVERIWSCHPAIIALATGIART